MRGLAAIAIGLSLGAGLLAACTLTTDLDGFTGGASGPPTESGTSGTSGTLPDGGTSGGSTLSEGGPDAAPACSIPTDSDPHNCGACGRDCLGGSCSGGACAPAKIGHVDGSPLGIAVSQGKLYAATNNSLIEMELDGSHPQSVVDGIAVRFMWGTDDAVYFADDLGGGVARKWAHTADGKTTAVSGVLGGLSGIAVYQSDLYFTRYNDEESAGGVYRLSLGGGEPKLLKKWNHPEDVAVGPDGKVYFAGDGQDQAIALHADGSYDILYSGGGPTGVAVRGDDLFVARQAAGDIVRVSLSTKATEIVASGLARPSGIVTTPSAIYWIETSNGNIDVLVR